MPTFRLNAPVVIRVKVKEVPMLTKVRDTLPLGKLVYRIGACKPGHTRALPRLFRIMRTHITRTRHTKTPILQMHAYARTDVSVSYSAQCSDKKGFPQLCIKFAVAKFCTGTHTALQVPMVYRIPYSCGQLRPGLHRRD